MLLILLGCHIGVSFKTSNHRTKFFLRMEDVRVLHMKLIPIFDHLQLPHISFNNCQIVTSSFIAFFFSVKFLSKKTFNSSIYLLDANCKQSKKSDLGLITNTEAFVRFMLDIWFSDGLQTGFVQKGLVSKCNCCFNEKFWSVLQNNVFDFFNSFV